MRTTDEFSKESAAVTVQDKEYEPPKIVKVDQMTYFQVSAILLRSVISLMLAQDNAQEIFTVWGLHPFYLPSVRLFR